MKIGSRNGHVFTHAQRVRICASLPFNISIENINYFPVDGVGSPMRVLEMVLIESGGRLGRNVLASLSTESEEEDLWKPGSDVGVSTLRSDHSLHKLSWLKEKSMWPCILVNCAWVSVKHSLQNSHVRQDGVVRCEMATVRCFWLQGKCIFRIQVCRYRSKIFL